MPSESNSLHVTLEEALQDLSPDTERQVLASFHVTNASAAHIPLGSLYFLDPFLPPLTFTLNG